MIKDSPGELRLGGLTDWRDVVGKMIVAVEHHTVDPAGRPVLGGRGPKAPTTGVLFLSGGGFLFASEVTLTCEVLQQRPIMLLSFGFAACC